MLVWCMMFRQALGGSARNLFDDLDPKCIDGFEELSRKFLEDQAEIHGIDQNPNEGIQVFLFRLRPKSSHIKGEK